MTLEEFKNWLAEFKHNKKTTLLFLCALLTSIIVAAYITSFVGEKAKQHASPKKVETTLIKDKNTQQNQTNLTKKYNNLANSSPQEYVSRYLKEPVAENLKLDGINITSAGIEVKFSWESSWESQTSHYRVGIETRVVTITSSEFLSEWKHAKIVKAPELESDQTFNLSAGSSAVISGLKRGKIYDIRLIDNNYDSDDPPSGILRVNIPTHISNDQNISYFIGIFQLNTDYKKRDKLLGISIDWQTVPSGTKEIKFIDYRTIEQLMKNNFLNPNDRQNESPSASEILAFLQLHPTVFAHGYVVSPYREDYRITLEGIQVKPKDTTVETKLAVFEFCKDADEVLTTSGLYCWWD